MRDRVHHTAQGNFGAVFERRCPRQPVEPRRDPGAVPLGKLTGLSKAAARGHSEDGFARDSHHAQRIATGLAMTTQANEMDGAVADDLDSLRFCWTTVKQCAQSHGLRSPGGFWWAIVAHSPGWQGIFFWVSKSTSSWDYIAARRKL